MKILRYANGIGNSWELNFVGKIWNLRIARHQVALWKNFKPIFWWLNPKRPGASEAMA